MQSRRDVSFLTAHSLPRLEQFHCSMCREQQDSQQRSDTPQAQDVAFQKHL